MTLSLLVVASETPDQQAARRARAGQASHETFAETLRRLDPDVDILHVSCVTDAPPSGGASMREALTTGRMAGLSGVLFAGSPIQMHEETAETRAAAAFMERVYASGVPSFGSCAGLQMAAVGAGGTVKPREDGMEAGFARGIVACEPDHPLVRGRPLTWDALAMHSSEIDRLPSGMTVLARTRATPVQAAEIRSGEGVHWGVQYHPELSPGEIAGALRRAAGTLAQSGLAPDRGALERHAAMIEALGAGPARRDLAWQMGVQVEIADETWRTVEIANFLAHLRERG